MKISNTRVRQYVSPYDQSRIDAAIQKSDSRVLSRAIADKAREEAIKAREEAIKALEEADKATAEYNKSLLDTEKSRLDAEKAQFDLEKANIDLIKANVYKARMDLEKIQLEKEQIQIEYNQTIALAETIRLNNEQLALTYGKDILDKERLVLSKEVAQIDSERVQILQNIAILSVEQSRLDLEKLHINNAAAANAYKAQSYALIVAQRSKIMKMLQLLSIETRKTVDELYFNKSVISITNIYQKTYNNNKCATGFGDFIRGCYFMLDFCEMFHFQPNIVINHPLDEFLENHSITNNYDISQMMVSMFEDNNCIKHILNHDNIIINTIRKNETIPQFVNYLYALPIDNNNINIYNIVFPYIEVSEEHQQVMRHILKPNLEMKEYVVSTLENFELTENNYISIHIRSGDSYLNGVDKQFNLTYLNHITNSVIMLLNKHPNTYFFLIADNTFIKLHLSSKKIHRLNIMFNEIGHLGENTQLDRNQVKNTMLDFYLFAYSSRIYAFSSYDHGSGFSWWCAKTYGIPYSCEIIKP